MQDFFRYDSDDARESLLNRARNVALTALKQYDLPWERIQFIQLSDTITFKIETSTKNGFLLRIHSDRLSKAEIHSELIFLSELNTSGDITVPEAIRSREGFEVLEIETESGFRHPYVTVMRWLEGRHAQGDLNELAVKEIGSMVARLHETSVNFVPPPDFVCPTWGAESFKKEFSKLELYYTWFLSPEEWIVYQAAADEVLSRLSTMQPNVHNYGLIHGDMHLGNIIFKEETPYPIDFGRCGLGYYLYDMANALLGLYPQKRLLLIEGYERIRKLEVDFTRDLECFFIMHLIEGYCHHAPDPRETANLIEEQPYAQALIREFLSGEPFLFNIIEPVAK